MQFGVDIFSKIFNENVEEDHGIEEDHSIASV